MTTPQTAHLFITVLVPRLQSSPRNFPLCSFTAAATLLVRSSLLSVIMSLVTLCWAVKAQGQGQILESVARWEQSLRSRGILELSIRSSETRQERERRRRAYLLSLQTNTAIQNGIDALKYANCNFLMIQDWWQELCSSQNITQLVTERQNL